MNIECPCTSFTRKQEEKRAPGELSFPVLKRVQPVPDLDKERTLAIPLVRSIPIPHLHDCRKMEVCLIN